MVEREGQAPGERLPEHHAERELVAALVAGVVADPLGCEVGERAGARYVLEPAELAGAVERVEIAREREVDHDRAAVVGHDHVARLDVAVDEPGRVRGCEAAPSRDRAGEDLAGRGLLAEPLPEVAADQELEHEVAIAGRRPVVVDGHDVAVAHASERLSFARGLEQLARRHDLDGDEAIERAVEGLVDRARPTHARLAEPLDHLEASADDQRAVGGRGLEALHRAREQR